MSGWECRVLLDTETEPLDEANSVKLVQLDDAGEEWFAEGPGGSAAGSLDVTLRGSAPDDADPAWLDAVLAAIARELRVGVRRRSLLVMRGTNTWFHASAARNRESILAHGLDWRRMSPPGIAGSRAAEWEGTFLCESREQADWFAGICREPAVDVWEVDVPPEVWLEGAPDASGGGARHWMICPESIAPERLRLLNG